MFSKIESSIGEKISYDKNLTSELKNTLIDTLKHITNRGSFLKSELETADGILLDLRHLIELGDDMDAPKMCKIHKVEREMYRKRRAIKDELEEIKFLCEQLRPFGILQTSKLDKISNAYDSRVYANSKENKSRCYRVRVLQDALGETIQ